MSLLITSPTEQARPLTTSSTASTATSWVTRRLDNTTPSMLLLEGFFGLGWLRAAAEKLPNADWWSGDVIHGFVTSHVDATLPWYQPVLDVLVSPFAVAIGIVVVVLQLFAGASLLSGFKLKWGLAAGIFLNLSFLAVGAVNPSAFYLIGQGALALTLLGAARPTERVADKMRMIVGAAFGMILVNIPFVRTLDVHGVIEDPAMMFITLGILTMVTVAMTYRSVFALGYESVDYESVGSESVDYESASRR